MAGPETSNNPEMLDRAASKLDAVSSKLSEVSNRMGTLFGKLTAEGTENLIKHGDILKSITGQTNDLTTASEKTKNSINSIDLSSLSSGLGSLVSVGKKVFDNLSKSAAQSSKDSSREMGVLGNMLNSLIVAGSTGIKLKMMEGSPIFQQINTVQENLMAVEEAALQTGISIGDGFEKSSAHVGGFTRSLTDSMITTRQTRDEVLKIQRGLAETFGTGATTGISNLARAQNHLHGTLNLTNVALLTQRATGMDAGAVSDMLTKSYLELGVGIDGAALNLGRMKDVADRSGLPFKRVSESIMSSADTLKLFGGTVQSVAPLFDAFSKSLSGTGRQGLTPDLVTKLAGGLNAMAGDLGKMSLLSMQGAPTGPGGAIGGGLEMEAALEQGPAGMAKIIDKLGTLLESKGGGKILTRAEAIADPAQQRNFVVQRELLKNMMGVDTANANKMLEMMQGVKQNGLQVGGDQEQKLGELIGSGQKVAENTTSILKNATVEAGASALKAGDNVVRAIRETAFGRTLSGVLDRLSDATREAVQKGSIGWSDMNKLLLKNSTKEERAQLKTFGFDLEKKSIQPLEHAALNKPEPKQTAEAMAKKASEDTLIAASTRNLPKTEVGIGKVSEKMAENKTSNAQALWTSKALDAIKGEKTKNIITASNVQLPINLAPNRGPRTATLNTPPVRQIENQPGRQLIIPASIDATQSARKESKNTVEKSERIIKEHTVAETTVKLKFVSDGNNTIKVSHTEEADLKGLKKLYGGDTHHV